MIELPISEKEKDAEQKILIEADEWWREYWVGMPEFIQNDLRPYKTVVVHFETNDDMKFFSKIVGQEISLQTQYIWYPRVKREKRKYVYVDENENS